ncbi:MAG: beta-mannosidase [Bacteroidaceae bacterium]|nr:beta-mannosidase [Bacteroidaceae bacterium]
MRKTSFIHILLMLFMVSGISAQESRQLSPEAEALLQYLKEIEGEKTLSGTTANVNWNINEAKWVNKHTGKWPALNFFDFIHLPFSPSNWIDYSNITEVYNWHKNGGIVGCMWHWNMPTNDGQDWTCTPGTGNKETGFDVRKIFEPESAEYKQMMNDIDKVASTLKKLKQRKIPVLWRPLHEAGGQWFWWGLDAEACNELWRVMYDRFTNRHGLNNLIWVWTSAAEWNKPYSDGYKWYPGDEYVDIVGIDIYNNSSASNINSTCFKMLKQHSPDKLIALTECGNLATISQQWKAGARWLYFAPWYDYERTNKPDSEAFKSTEHTHCNAAWWTEAFSNDYVLSREDFKQELQTSLKAVQAEQTLAPSGSYDLFGHPWTEGRRGIFIKNGKKYIRK